MTPGFKGWVFHFNAWEQLDLSSQQMVLKRFHLHIVRGVILIQQMDFRHSDVFTNCITNPKKVEYVQLQLLTILKYQLSFLGKGLHINYSNVSTVPNNKSHRKQRLKAWVYYLEIPWCPASNKSINWQSLRQVATIFVAFSVSKQTKNAPRI